MRGTAVFLVLCLVSVGVHADLAAARAQLRDAKTIEDKRSAIAVVAKTGTGDAAKFLTRAWNRAAQGLPKLRRDLFAARVKARRAAAKPRKAGDTREATAWRAKVTALDTRVRDIELEMAAFVAGLESMKTTGAVQWMANDGLKVAKSAVLREMFARKGVASKEGRAALLDRIGGASKAVELIPLLRALRTASDLDPEQRLPILIKLLNHRDWGVRIAAGHVLAKAARVEAIAPLIRTLARQANRSRSQREIAAALEALTGQSLGPYPDQWKKWWRDNEAAILEGKVDLELKRQKWTARKERQAEQGHIYGIPQQADRIIYVFDRSGSMEVSMKRPRFVDGGAIPADDDEDSRFEAAGRELVNAFRRLRDDSLFAVVLYSDDAVPMHEELTTATKEAADDVKRRLDRMGPEGRTNIYAALDYALRLARAHPDSKPGAAQADAIFLISDGSPTNADGKVEDPARTLEAVREWNALQRVAIHTIGIGRSHNAPFLRALAEQNGGEYHAVVPGKKKKRK